MIDTTLLSAPSSGGADNSARLRQLNALPVFNPTATRILSLTDGSERCLTDLEQVFRADPGLTTELLISANSAAFGGRARVSTILHALALLGIDRVRSLAMTVAMSEYVRSNIPPQATSRIWAHAVATAVVAEELAHYSDGVSGSLLYTAGLMHDVGRLGLLANMKDLYQTFLNTEFLNIYESEEVEKQSFGVTHSLAGEFLAEKWGFPLVLCDCCRSHHDLTETNGEEVGIIQTACIIADGLGYPEMQVQKRAKSVAADIWLDECAGNSMRESIKEKIQAFSL